MRIELHIPGDRSSLTITCLGDAWRRLGPGAIADEIRELVLDALVDEPVPYELVRFDDNGVVEAEIVDAESEPPAGPADPDARRAVALRLLDEEGLDRAHVAAQLGVSLAQVRRWDEENIA